MKSFREYLQDNINESKLEIVKFIIDKDFIGIEYNGATAQPNGTLKSMKKYYDRYNMYPPYSFGIILDDELNANGEKYLTGDISGGSEYNWDSAKVNEVILNKLKDNGTPTSLISIVKKRMTELLKTGKISV